MICCGNEDEREEYKEVNFVSVWPTVQRIDLRAFQNRQLLQDGHAAKSLDTSHRP